jgi:DNA repair protein RecN (Recombination protein N)
MATELAALEGLEERREAAAERLASARALAQRLARKLTEARLAAAESLGRRVTETLARLQMAAARFAVTVEPLAAREGDPEELRFAGTRLAETGADRVEFQIAPNRGEKMHPLSRIASGGELSRVMLALKLATADADAVATYIFDEVDAGIGGAVAETVGQVIREVGRHRQVLCVTHLPQIAACADVHLSVEKRNQGKRTVQRVQKLDDAGRREELARMMAGLEVTAQARAHAAELLRRARG